MDRTDFSSIYPSPPPSCLLLVIAVQVKEETIDPSLPEFEATELPVPISSIKQEVTD